MARKCLKITYTAIFINKSDKEIVSDLKSQGILTEDSTPESYTATTGNAARFAYAASSAAAMQTDERMMVGGRRAHLSQNLSSGGSISKYGLIYKRLFWTLY